MTLTTPSGRTLPDSAGPQPDDHNRGGALRARATRLVRGPETAPRWARPALLVLLAATALLYTWDLSASGMANSYYAAAVQAGTKSWKALFFGSLDAGNSITVDKPPASLWVMSLSGRIFGFNSWSMLVPQALEGVAAVGLLYGAVRRWSGHGAGLVAAGLFALTPVSVLMFRFNNPDALLVLLLVAAAYAVVRAVEHGSTWWLMFAGSAVGFGFLTKMLQALLVLPALGLVYLIAAPTALRRRLGQLALATLVMVVSAGWWVATVALWPAASRPYIGGSTNNSVLELAFGYNGLSRLTGNSGGGGAGGATGFSGAAGMTRLFAQQMGAQISFLLPAALVCLVVGLWLSRRMPRTSTLRAAIVLWGGWLVVTAVVFSYMQGTVHPYYTVALAPAIGALIAVTGRAVWEHNRTWFARIAMSGVVAATGAWTYVVLDRDPTWFPALRYAVAISTVLACIGLLVGLPRVRKGAAVVVLAAGLAGLIGPVAYSVQTAATPHTGATPSAGPAGAGMSFGGRALGTGRPGNGAVQGGAPGAGSGGASAPSPSGAGAGAPARAGGSFGGGDQTVSTALQTLLRASTARWSAATTGAQSAASLELATGTSVMGIGGFTGSDPAPTLAQFEAYVASGEIGYFIAGNGGGQGGPGASSGTGDQISAWVAANFAATTVGGQTVYDLGAATN